MSEEFSQWVYELDPSDTQKIDALRANSPVLAEVMQRIYYEFQGYRGDLIAILVAPRLGHSVANQIASMIQKSIDHNDFYAMFSVIQDLRLNNALLYQAVLDCVGPRYIFDVTSVPNQ